MKTLIVFAFAIIAFATARRHHGKPPCGLPPFVDKLPAERAEELRQIWKNYKKGTDCESERDETKNLIESLPWHVRKSIFHHHGPSFLRNATDDVRQQFKQLWHNRTLKGEAKAAAARQLAQRTLNADQMKEFQKWAVEQDKKHREFEAKLQKLSPEARTAFDKLESLREQKAEIFAGLSSNARDELHELWSRRGSRGAAGGSDRRRHKGNRKFVDADEKQ